MAIRENHGTDWIDCIFGQLDYRFNKMRTQQKDHLTEEKYNIGIDDAGNKEVVGNISNWLWDGKLTNHIAPHQAKGINGNLPPLPHNASYLTVAEFCLERYQIDIDQYAKIVSEKEAQPTAAMFDFELAIFVFSQIYDEVRVSPLCPQEKKTKMWKIWDLQRDIKKS